MSERHIPFGTQPDPRGGERGQFPDRPIASRQTFETLERLSAQFPELHGSMAPRTGGLDVDWVVEVLAAKLEHRQPIRRMMQG